MIIALNLFIAFRAEKVKGEENKKKCIRKLTCRYGTTNNFKSNTVYLWTIPWQLAVRAYIKRKESNASTHSQLFFLFLWEGFELENIKKKKRVYSWKIRSKPHPKHTENPFRISINTLLQHYSHLVESQSTRKRKRKSFLVYLKWDFIFWIEMTKLRCWLRTTYLVTNIFYNKSMERS